VLGADVPQFHDGVGLGGGDDQVGPRRVKEGEGGDREVAAAAEGGSAGVSLLDARGVGFPDGLDGLDGGHTIGQGAGDLAWWHGRRGVLASVPDADGTITGAGGENIGVVGLKLDLFDGAGVACQCPDGFLGGYVNNLAGLVARGGGEVVIVVGELEVHHGVVVGFENEIGLAELMLVVFGGIDEADVSFFITDSHERIGLAAGGAEG
jgi:hypothetical protein